MRHLLADGTFAARQVNGRGAWGPKYKRLGYKGAPVDLFGHGRRLGADADDQDRAERLQQTVSHASSPGRLAASGLPGQGRLALEAGIPVPVPTEQHLYVILGREYDPPQRRTSP